MMSGGRRRGGVDRTVAYALASFARHVRRSFHMCSGGEEEVAKGRQDVRR